MPAGRVIPGLVVVLALLAPPAPGGESPARSAEPPIRVAVAGPMSGPLGSLGQSLRNAAELAVAEWNRAGGLLGRKIQLVVLDDKFDLQTAADGARRLLKEGAWGVVGHLNSSISLSVAPLYGEAGVPMITPASTDPRLTEQGSETVFRTCGRDDQQGTVAADFALRPLKARRLAVVHDRTPYGQVLAEAFAQQAERRQRGGLVAQADLVQGEKEYPATVAALKAARPDAIFYGGIFREAAVLVRDLRRAGVGAAFLSGEGALDLEFVKLAGEEAAAGAYLTFAANARLLPGAQALIERYEKKYGPVGMYTLHAYDATNALLQAIRAARPEDGSRVELLKISRALRATLFEGTLGRLRWDRKGDLAQTPYVVYVVRKGGGLLGWFDALPRPEPAETRPEARGPRPRPRAALPADRP
jgi:branched-chain amino acid transport system substrate-binding protein